LGINPLPSMTLPASARSVIEFSIRATADAAYGSTYVFRVTDLGAELPGSVQATVVMAARPPVILTPGQRYGLADTAGSDGSRVPTRFGLTSDTDPEAIHGPAYSLSTDTCAACHRAHDASGTMLTVVAPPQMSLCVSCHNGTDAPDVASAYASVPANDVASRAYYQHDPTQIDGELGNRNECSDCHNPHNITSSASVAGPSGWSASGQIAASGGVAVTNGSPGTAPTYTLLASSTLEYQLCLKCHSGYATLPSNVGQPPSRNLLDAGIEFNPGNGSYHPVEAAGTNGTTQMAASLLGTSSYKMWNLTPSSTLRCSSCHSDSRLLSSAIARNTPLAADATLPVHASPERGILLAAYRDRVLKNPLETYSATDFALCFVCHAEAPFRDTSGNVRPDTNFRYHGVHVSGSNLIDHGSSGTNIDVPGDGGGLATCAECHFRIHSSAFPVSGQDPGPRLVDFAPDVTGAGGNPIDWQPISGTDPGTCALKCHGQPHNTSY
jgi:predicted CXXCH cytochrome family protein